LALYPNLDHFIPSSERGFVEYTIRLYFECQAYMISSCMFIFEQ